MNKVIICGRLTKSPEVRYSNQTERTLAIARYTLAVDRRKKTENGQSADFINCIAFDRAAEFAERYFQKGTKLLVTGRLQTGSYINKDGTRVYTTDVVVEDQEFAESKLAAESRQPEQNDGRHRPSDDGFMDIPSSVDDAGLPFY